MLWINTLTLLMYNCVVVFISYYGLFLTEQNESTASCACEARSYTPSTANLLVEATDRSDDVLSVSTTRLLDEKQLVR